MKQARNRLALLVPIFNGGGLLRDTLESTVHCDLDGPEWQVIIVDNASTDGGCDELPETTKNGAAIQVHRNGTNLGRIGNWNRALTIAEEQGFDYAAFLFAGDVWLKNGSIRALVDELDRVSAIGAFAPFYSLDGDLEPIRLFTRFGLGREFYSLSSNELMELMLDRGHLPITPLQANVYKLGVQVKLRFDEGRPHNTDVDATLSFLTENPGPVLLARSAFAGWRCHGGRFFMKADICDFLVDYEHHLRLAADLSGLPVNWSKAKSTFIISALLGLRLYGQSNYARSLAKLWSYVKSSPGRLDWLDLWRICFAKYWSGRSLLHIN